jgi:hypothetical protein
LAGALLATVFAAVFGAAARGFDAGVRATVFGALFFRAAAVAFFATFFAALRAGFAAFLLAGADFFGAVFLLRVDFARFAGRAVFARALAGRLAMVESFRNLDSFSISVVLSDAYRKSDGAAEHLLTSRNCGPPDPAIRTPALVRMELGLSGPFVRRQEECARHGKR